MHTVSTCIRTCIDIYKIYRLIGSDTDANADADIRPKYIPYSYMDLWALCLMIVFPCRPAPCRPGREQFAREAQGQPRAHRAADVPFEKAHTTYSIHSYCYLSPLGFGI